MAVKCLLIRTLYPVDMDIVQLIKQPFTGDLKITRFSKNKSRNFLETIALKNYLSDICRKMKLLALGVKSMSIKCMSVFYIQRVRVVYMRTVDFICKRTWWMSVACEEVCASFAQFLVLILAFNNIIYLHHLKFCLKLREEYRSRLCSLV
jgi:hypothetical protein